MRKMNAEPSNSRPFSPYHHPPRIHPTKPHPLIPVLYSPTTAPLACTFTRQPTHKPPHICALSPLLLRTFPQISMGNPLHRCAPSPTTHALTISFLSTNAPTVAHLHPCSCVHFPRISMGKPPHRCAPSPTTHAQTLPLQRTFTLISTHLRVLFYREGGAVVRCNRSILPYKQIVAPTLSEGMYGGIRKKSIGYPRKVYRVFPESL